MAKAIAQPQGNNGAVQVAIESPAHAHELLNHMLIGAEIPEGITFEQLFEYLKEVDDKDLQEVSAQYWKPKENETYFFIFKRFVEKTIKGKPTKCAELLDENGIQYISGATVLISNLNGLTVLPAWIKVKTLKYIAVSQGKYLDMVIKTVPTAIAEPADM